MIPVIGCLVRTPDGGIGKVRRLAPEDAPEKAELALGPTERGWRPLAGLRSGFQPAMEVEHPDRIGRAGHGHGHVLAVRTPGGLDQVLVQFADNGETRWLRRDNLDATSATIRMRERRRWRTEGRA